MKKPGLSLLRFGRTAGVSLALATLASSCACSDVPDTIDLPDVPGLPDEVVVPDVLTPPPQVEPPPSETDDIPRPMDLLFVVDNSGSMCEEQQRLKDAFFDPACPIVDVNAVPDEYRSPPPDVLAALGESCGLIQMLAALEVDVRVGVISTDVGPCDNRYGLAEAPDNPLHCGGAPHPDWGRKPQRGCLQAPAGAPTRYVDLGEVDMVTGFYGLVNSLGTYGSAYERGFDAARAFLEGDAHPDCSGHRDLFLRDGADLTLVFVSDEDDCSHLDSPEFPDENAGDTCDGPFFGDNLTAAQDCYRRPELLIPIGAFRTWLLDWAEEAGKRARVAAVSGGVYEEGFDNVLPAGCLVDPEGKPDGTCTLNGGTSNISQLANHLCNPDNLAENDLAPCCTGEPGERYLRLAGIMGQRGFADSICYDDYRKTFTEVAELAARR